MRGRLRPRFCLALFALAMVGGCTGLQPPQRDHLASTDPRLAECAHWFETLDAAVRQSEVGDAGAHRVSGFPYLRIDRFLEAMKADARTDGALRRAWIDALRELDHTSRALEIANLPQSQVERLAGGDRERLGAQTQECAQRLLLADRGDPMVLETLFRQAYVADDYSRLKRALGLYELTRLPFYAGVSSWQEDVIEVFGRQWRDAAGAATFVRYSPDRRDVFTQQEVAALLAQAAEHPLGLARLSSDQRERLFATYAPVIDIETEGPFDRIGRLYWSNDATPQVDVGRPVVYRRLGYTRVDGRTLLQLVYTAWLPRRPADGGFDLLAGHLDGIVWRVTLDADGAPLLFDSIHPCGCYHKFFPTSRLELRPAPEPWIEWAFVPAVLPALDASRTLRLSLQTRTHYLLDVSVEADVLEGETYAFADYDELRSLPLPGGGNRSLFGPDGLVAGSERGERYLFWPMGIASPGAMRQAGTQATAFVGRRHFDDPDLVEKRFRRRH